ncbi:ribosome modulation factor [Methylobacterium sp. WSM2598]|uniref:ribosome modulation factor n=1 Tax=Methylobacterium sp. WSM2598 TaxID=398261 RepID=UPI000A00B7EE|nr:Rmf/CrpP family protein [Methylobacterium sp. WSM2598]
MPTSDHEPSGLLPDRTPEGVRARQHGKPRDACPYPLGSEEREEWLEGFDGRTRRAPPDQPKNPAE